MFYQTISNKIMLKNIKRGIKSNIVIINIYNSTRYIFSNEIFKLPKILNTLKIKKKIKNKLKPIITIKNRSFIPSKTKKKYRYMLAKSDKNNSNEYIKKI